jgi:sugar lactone lactonase YvrE
MSIMCICAQSVISHCCSRAAALGWAALLAAVVPTSSDAQPAAPSQPAPRYEVGSPLGVRSGGPTGPFAPMSSNVAVYGGIQNAESCVYDADRGLIMVLNRGASQRVLANDAFVSLLKHDGSVHTSRWIGVQPPAVRRTLSEPLTLNDPFGSDIAGGVLYVADSDGNTTATDTRVAVIRTFDLRSGAPLRDIRVERSQWLNDLAVARDGTIYATQTGGLGPDADPASWQVLKISADGAVTQFAQGAPLRVPNGVALDPQGNVVVVNSGDSAVLTFSPSGALLRTEFAAQGGSDGLVIMPDGTKYISSVFQGGLSRLRPGRPAELIARDIPTAASMCYDGGAHQLVIPLNEQNGLAFVALDTRERDAVPPPAGRRDRRRAQAAGAASRDVGAELLALSRTKWRWMQARQTDSLDALFRSEAVFVHMGATMSKPQELDVIRSGGIQYKDVLIEDASVRIVGSTGIVLNTIKLTAVVGGNEVVNPFAVTEVYVRDDGVWHLASLSFTRLLR